MTIFLRQATASQEILFPPLLDDTDGKTAETGLTIANTDIKIWKQGGTSEASKNSGGATHIASGRYYAVLDATDTDTIGNLRASIHVAGALPVWLDCVVLDEAVYDVLFGTTALATPANVLAAACDTGVSLAKVGEMVAALAAGKVTASSSGGVTTLTYKMRDGTTTSFTVVVTESDKTRATTGSLS